MKLKTTPQGGAVLPLQEPPLKGPVNTAITRSSPLQLLVAPDSTNSAKGELYWDDGDSISEYWALLVHTDNDPHRDKGFFI